MKAAWALVAFASLAFVAACGGHSGSPGPLPSPFESPFTSPPTSPPTQAPFAPQNYIKHVVFIVQENRSFDNLFQGYPGADTASSGLTSTGQTVQLKATAINTCYDPNHNEIDFLTEFDGGKMDGFDKVGFSYCNPPADGAYAYVEPSESAPYFALAKQFVLADRMFASQIDASWTAHQFLIAAQSGLTVDAPDGQPWGCDAPNGTTVPTLNPDRTQGPGVFPCFGYMTLADELDAKGIAWRYYAPEVNTPDPNLGRIWSAYDAINQIRYGPDWNSDVIFPPSQILTDVAGGTLASVTWVVPDYQDSDHAGSPGGTGGPAWVTSVVNAIGNSQFWNSTAIFVMWDDWGGWYDHVAPAQISTQSLGMRVPLIVISPYAKADYVSHVSYETAGLLKFAETVFGLSALTPADARSLDFSDAFNFSQAPRTYAAIRRHLSGRRYLPHAPSRIAPDNE